MVLQSAAQSEAALVVLCRRRERHTDQTGAWCGVDQQAQYRRTRIREFELESSREKAALAAACWRRFNVICRWSNPLDLDQTVNRI